MKQIEISHIRFICNRHNEPLTNVGNGNIFYPTFTIAETVNGGPDIGFESRMDKEGWLTLDTSELGCDKCYDEMELGESHDDHQDWSIQAR